MYLTTPPAPPLCSATTTPRMRIGLLSKLRTLARSAPSNVFTDVRKDPSNASTDVRSEEHSTATDFPPHPSAVPIQYDLRATGLTEAKNSRTASTADEEVFTKQLVDIVHSFLRSHLLEMVRTKWSPSSKYFRMKCEFAMGNLIYVLKWWTGKNCCLTHEKSHLYKKFVCSPCAAAEGGSKEPCISLTGAGILFNQMTKEQSGNIGRLFAQVFTDSVCNVTKSGFGGGTMEPNTPLGGLRPWLLSKGFFF